MDEADALAAAADRFATDLAPLLTADGRFGLAVSGGADSLALLLLAEAAFAGRFEVATVDHRLRPESAAEAATVGALCAERAIAHTTLAVTVPGAGNLQAQARTARYAALGDWAAARGLGAVATAHHRDDQAETLLLRLSRGAGVRGLAGMRARSALPGRAGIALLRPLLGWSRDELASLVAGAGLRPAQDPSNADPRFARAVLRARLADAADWLDPAALAASAAHCGDADDALAWAGAREWDERVAAGAATVEYAPLAPRAVRLRVLERIVGQLGGDGTARGGELARWLAALESGGIATLGGVRGDGSRLPWRFAPAPPRRG